MNTKIVSRIFCISVSFLMLLCTIYAVSAALTVAYNASASQSSLLLHTRYRDITTSSAVLYNLDATSTYAHSITLHHSLAAENSSFDAENSFSAVSDRSHIISSSSFNERSLAAHSDNRSYTLAASGISASGQKATISTSSSMDSCTLVHGALATGSGTIEVRYAEQQPQTYISHRMRMESSSYNLSYLAEWHSLYPGATPGLNLSDISNLCVWHTTPVYPLPFR